MNKIVVDFYLHLSREDIKDNTVDDIVEAYDLLKYQKHELLVLFLNDLKTQLDDDMEFQDLMIHIQGDRVNRVIEQTLNDYIVIPIDDISTSVLDRVVGAFCNFIPILCDQQQ